MKQMKKRLALFLCMLLTVPTILGCFPMASMKAEAAPRSVYPQLLCGGTGFEVESGKEVSIAHIVGYKTYGTDGSVKETVKLSQVTGDSYTSSNPDVATISKDGKLKAKKTGTTTIMVSYKGAGTGVVVNVVKKGAHKASGSKYKKVLDLAKKLSKYKKVTAGNCYEISKLQGQFEKARENLVSSIGLKIETFAGPHIVSIGKLVLPELLLYDVPAIDDKMDEYVAKNNPVGTVSSKYFKIQGVSSKKNSRSFTIQLKSKANATQIFTVKKNYHKDSVIYNDKTARFPIWLKDTKTGYLYHGWATAAEKSNKIKVTMDYHKLKAGTKYALIGDEKRQGDQKGWTKGKTFTVPRR